MRVVAMLGVVDPLDLEPAALQLRDQPRRPLRMLIENTDLHNSPLLDRIWVLEQTRPALARGTGVRAARVSPGQRVLDMATGTGEAALMGAEAVGARGTIVGRHLVTDAARRAGEAPSAPHPARRDGGAGPRPTPRAARTHVLS